MSGDAAESVVVVSILCGACACHVDESESSSAVQNATSKTETSFFKFTQKWIQNSYFAWNAYYAAGQWIPFGDSPIKKNMANA